MDVILCEDIKNLGKTGDVIHVKEGFARNFLLPKKKAYPATQANIKRIEKRKQELKQKAEEQKVQAQELAEQLSHISCTVAVEVNDIEKMYGSVTEKEISQAITSEGFEVDINAIRLEKPIEELGIYEVAVNLHPEVEAKVRVWVTKK